jgi:hypothetical protein
MFINIKCCAGGKMIKTLFLILAFFLITGSVFASGERFILWESFEDITLPGWPLNWTYENSNGDDKTWETKKYGGLGERPQCVRYAASATVAANDWFFTPALTLNAGITYTLSFRYKVSKTSNQKMNVWFGSTQTSAGMTTQIYDNNTLTDTIMTLVSADFTVSTSGVYYIGFHCYSDVNQMRLFIDDILLSYPETDLTMTIGLSKELFTTGTPSFGPNDTIESVAIIKNIGTTDINFNQRFTIGSLTNLNCEFHYICINPTNDTLIFNITIEEAKLKGSHFQTLGPGEIAGKVYNLQSPFTFTGLGIYTLYVQYQNYHKHPDDPIIDVWMGRILSDPITFVIQ